MPLITRRQRFIAFGSIYIQLAKEIILNAIYQPGPHLTEGHEWPPGDAFTMIGRKRLDNLEQMTRVFPMDTKTEPLACGATFSSKLIGRISSGARPSFRCMAKKLSVPSCAEVCATKV